MEIQGGGNKEYEKVVKDCQEAISLEEVGIAPINMRRTRGGGILLEIRGDKEEEKAEVLAEKIKEVIKKNERARVWTLRKRLRMRLSGLPPGVRAEEIATLIAKEGGVDASRVRVGPLRTSVSGAGTALVSCPKEAAMRVAGAPGLAMGWARMGVSLLEKGDPQCFRCLGRGHLGRWCPSDIDRGACCLGCGREGHRIGVSRTARSVP